MQCLCHHLYWSRLYVYVFECVQLGESNVPLSLFISPFPCFYSRDQSSDRFSLNHNGDTVSRTSAKVMRLLEIGKVINFETLLLFLLNQSSVLFFTYQICTFVKWLNWIIQYWAWCLKEGLTNRRRYASTFYKNNKFEGLMSSLESEYLLI